MGAYKQTSNVKVVYGKVGVLKRKGQENTRYDLFDEDTGELLQQRWYDSLGRAIINKDWKHGNKGGKHEFPHFHLWDWSTDGERQKEDKSIDDNYLKGLIGELWEE